MDASISAFRTIMRGLKVALRVLCRKAYSLLRPWAGRRVEGAICQDLRLPIPSGSDF